MEPPPRTAHSLTQRPTHPPTHVRTHPPTRSLAHSPLQHAGDVGTYNVSAHLHEVMTGTRYVKRITTPEEPEVFSHMRQILTISRISQLYIAPHKP